MARRKRTPKPVERDVLVKSARRCCLCYGLQQDFSEKPGQIAHIDHNPANSSPNNLVFLCLPHHDAYDSTTSQTKGLTREEVLYYRRVLYVDVAKYLPRMTAESEEDPAKKLTEFISRVRKRDAFPSPLLNGYEIEAAVKEGVLGIDPFSRSGLHLSAYGLFLGTVGVIAHVPVTLSPQVPLAVRPGQFACVATEQFISLPPGLVGRILAMPALSRLGLSLTSPITVDSGFQGRLFLAMANHGNEQIALAVGDEIARLEFMLFNMPPREWT